MSSRSTPWSGAAARLVVRGVHLEAAMASWRCRGRLVGRVMTWALVLAGTVGAAAAQSWSATNVQALHGRGFELGDGERDILTFEHASGWSLGSNFFFFDVTEPFGGDSDIYGEWYSRLALEQAGDHRTRGPAAPGRLLRRLPERRERLPRLPGRGDAPLQGAPVLVPRRRRDGLRRPERQRRHLHRHAGLGAAVRVGGLGCRFRGFVDLIGPEGERSAQLLTQPQLLVDLGRLWGTKDKLFAGVEYQYWHNKFGVDGVDESLPQVMLLWQF